MAKRARHRRVLLLPRVGANHLGAYARWAEEYERGRRARVKLHPVCAITHRGIEHRMPVPGDEVGYAMSPYEHDGCFQAALATATQVPIEQIPDLRIGERLRAGEHPAVVSRTSWERIEAWADKRGLVLTIHDELPVNRRRWIGVVPSADDNPLGDHCLVLNDQGLLIFDPAIGCKPPPGMNAVGYDTDTIMYGVSLDRKDGS